MYNDIILNEEEIFIIEKIRLYSRKLKPYARVLRKEMTISETILWSKIRRKQIQNVQFLRQKPLGPYILDFYAKKPQLAIEVDGNHHQYGPQKERDIGRDIFLSEQKIHILRFSNYDIEHDCQSVIHQIEQVILELLPLSSDI